MDINLPRGETAILFSILFVTVGFISPIVYVTVAPDNQFVEVHEFDATDTHVGADNHNICFDRTVHRPSNVDIVVEMMLLREDGTIVEQDSFEIDAYYQQGREEVIINRNIRDNNDLQSGTYRYVHSVELNYYGNRVAKGLTFTSERFTVYESEEKLKANGETTCV